MWAVWRVSVPSLAEWKTCLFESFNSATDTRRNPWTQTQMSQITRSESCLAFPSRCARVSSDADGVRQCFISQCWGFLSPHDSCTSFASVSFCLFVFTFCAKQVTWNLCIFYWKNTQWIVNTHTHTHSIVGVIWYLPMGYLWFCFFLKQLLLLLPSVLQSNKFE